VAALSSDTAPDSIGSADGVERDICVNADGVRTEEAGNAPKLHDRSSSPGLVAWTLRALSKVGRVGIRVAVIFSTAEDESVELSNR
jgi:hypothetical protein